MSQVDADGAGDRPPVAGTPRIANRLLRRVRDFAEVRGDGTVDLATAAYGLAAFGVDARGLDKVDRAILYADPRALRGGPVGLSTLAIASASRPRPWRTSTSRSSSGGPAHAHPARPVATAGRLRATSA